MKSILVFDDIQRQVAKEQAASMRGSDQPLNECIEFGRMWAKIGFSFARQDYEATRTTRKRLRESEEPDSEDTERLLKEPPAGTRLIKGMRV